MVRQFASIVLIVPCLAFADGEDASLHGQATYIHQSKPPFEAAYSGVNSLRADRARNYSFSGTLFAGTRTWEGGEAYFNPEVVQGVAISDLTGMGGLPDGELAKSASPVPKWYRARAFMRHTVGFGGGDEEVEAGANQLAGRVDKRRLVVTAGNLSLKDLFDLNRYASDPRTDFMNASIVTSGAYDYAADSHGYSWGLAVEWFDDGWALRAARFMEPRESNGLPLDWAINRHHGDQVEVERALDLAGHPGKVRVMAFRNKAFMGGFRDALARARATGDVPDLRRVLSERVKHGYVVNVEQELAAGVGAFAKASWNDGHSETYSYIEVDRSFSAGVVLEGKRWSRDGDEAGVAWVQNGLASPHRDYLAAGGHGFFIGDGALSYRPERIVEAYYQVAVAKHLTFALDFQRAANPAYNADRGPVRFYGARAHAEF